MREMDPLRLAEHLPGPDTDISSYLEDDVPAYLRQNGIPPTDTDVATENGTRRTGWYVAPVSADPSHITVTTYQEAVGHIGFENPATFPTRPDIGGETGSQLQDTVYYFFGHEDGVAFDDGEGYPHHTVPEWLHEFAGEEFLLEDFEDTRKARNVEDIIPQG
ncbi:MAG: hypothetical protein SVW02_03950, partial [Candidatus Nanohaloarchaea archaeon]|nr:hypothetical protein [Candidatus Nanohaloarchaea archaeon]